MNPRPQKQHYVPRCWLKGFTDTGEKGGTLYVTNLKDKTQRKTTPGGCGYDLDFYRVSMPGIDSQIFEDALGSLENVAGPVFASMFKEKRGPLVEEMDAFVSFVAVQYSRVPAFRQFVLDFRSLHYKSFLELVSRDEATWTSSGLAASMARDHQGFSREQALDILATWDHFTLTAPAEWHVIEAYKASTTVFPMLWRRNWPPLVSPSGGFIGSDNPVYLDGVHGKMIGFGSEDGVVSFPANRHCLALGVSGRCRPIHVTRNLIARQNTLTMLHATEEVYSHEPQFCWMDGQGVYQTDWRLFSKEAVLEEHRKNADHRRIFTPIQLY